MKRESVGAVVGAADGLAGVGLHDVEVGTKVEILRHAETRVARAQEAAASPASGPAEDFLAQLAAHDRVLADVDGKDLEPDSRKRLGQEGGTDRLGVLPAAEVQRILAQAHRDQTQRQK